MKYFRVKWKHTNPDEPVYIFSELDDRGKELRKMECFQNGFCDYATPTESTGNAALITRLIPDLSVIARDPEFEPVEIAQEEFEKVWRTRRYP
jgi:hypothetical protein